MCKLTKKKARKLLGLIAVINQNEIKRSDNRSWARFTQFTLEITNDGGYQDACLTSQKHVWSNCNSGSLFKDLAFGGHEPTTVYLYNDVTSYEEFNAVVRFARAAIKAGGLDKLKYGTIKVVSQMTDYLDFEIKP